METFRTVPRFFKKYSTPLCNSCIICGYVKNKISAAHLCPFAPCLCFGVGDNTLLAERERAREREREREIEGESERKRDRER